MQRRAIFVGILVCVSAIFITGRLRPAVQSSALLSLVGILSKQSDVASLPDAGREKPLTPARAWALAASGVLTEKNRERHDSLVGGERSTGTINNVRRRLSESRGINSREELLSALTAVKEHGHHEEFERKGRFLEGLNTQGYETLIKDIGSNEEYLHQLAVLQKYYKKLGRKGLIGWDLSRYISLCRWGYTVGYLNEEEAWQKIMPVAGTLQRTFDSWDDLGQNYLIGREFWSYEVTKEDGALADDAYRRLIDEPTSPWNKYSWDLNLSE